MCTIELSCTRIRVFLVLIACALLAFAGSPAAAAQTNPDPTISATPIAAYAYVGTNVSGNGQGYVTDYLISLTGTSLSATGHSVSGASGSLAVNSRFVFATDGTNIVTYTRGSNGDLYQTSSVNGTAHNITPQGSEVGSIVLDRTGQTLYATEINYDGADDDAYTIWKVNSDGSLLYIAATGISADYFTPLTFSGNDVYAYSFGCYFAGWQINGFTRNTNNGMLSSFNPNAAIPPSNDGQMWCPDDLAVSAMNYVAIDYNDVGNPGSNYMLATYTLNSDGTLGLVQNSETTTPFNGEHSMVFDPTGTYLAVAGNAGIQMYRLQTGGTLAPVGSVVDANVAFNVVRWDNSGHLYAISSSGLYIFTSSSGVLRQDPGSPLPVSQAGSLAVLPAQ